MADDVQQAPSPETDFYGWAMETATQLRAGRLETVDLDLVAEEIESLGKAEYRELVNRLVVLLAHLLKWATQEQRRSRSWELTIKDQRVRIAAHLRQNPSLRPRVAEAMQDAYPSAVIKAMRESKLDEASFAPACPFAPEQVLSADFWPSDC